MQSKPDSTAFSDLDQLYTQILSIYPSAVNIVQVLGIIMLHGLSSLMDKNGEGLNKESYVIPHFAHASSSFGDYLFDSSRSGPFHVNRQEHENQVTIRSFALITRLIRS